MGQVSIGSMRAALGRILDEDWIVVLGSGIALGYTLLNFAEAVGATVVTAFEREQEGELFGDPGRLLAFRLGNHVVAMEPVVRTLLAFVIVLAVVAFAVSRLERPADEGTREAPP
jgi:D-arabinose 1-dehydrogenase-like Zn-dependent alcohol dehydrogenase